jgi:hypothetical protein
VTGTLATGRLVDPLTWTTLTLMNSWTGGPFSKGQPAIALDGQGIVHFRGAMREATSTFNAIPFTLPTQFRPAHTVFVVVGTFNDTTGRLQINTDGTVFVQSNPSSNGGNFTSLDGVTYSLG